MKKTSQGRDVRLKRGIQGLVILILAGSAAFGYRFFWPQKAITVDSSIDKAYEYLFQQAPLPADVYMLMGQAALLTNRSDTLKRLEKTEIEASHPAWMAKTTALLAFEKRLIPDSTPEASARPLAWAAEEVPFTKVRHEVFMEMAKFVGMALLCEHASAQDLRGMLHFIDEPSRDYILAHQALASIIMRAKGCLTTRRSQEMYAKVIHALAAETTPGDVSDDLAIERVALLAMAGYGHQLRPLFQKELIASQNRDGSWNREERIRHPDWVQTLTVEHATGLALYALAAMQASQPSTPNR